MKRTTKYLKSKSIRKGWSFESKFVLTCLIVGILVGLIFGSIYPLYAYSEEVYTDCYRSQPRECINAAGELVDSNSPDHTVCSNKVTKEGLENCSTGIFKKHYLIYEKLHTIHKFLGPLFFIIYYVSLAYVLPESFQSIYIYMISFVLFFCLGAGLTGILFLLFKLLKLQEKWKAHKKLILGLLSVAILIWLLLYLEGNLYCTKISTKDFDVKDINLTKKNNIRICLKKNWGIKNVDLLYREQNEKVINKLREEGYIIIESKCNVPTKSYDMDYEGNICPKPLTDCYNTKSYSHMVVCAKTGDFLVGVQNVCTIRKFAEECNLIEAVLDGEDFPPAVSTCIKEWKQNPPDYDKFYIDFKEDIITKKNVKKYITEKDVKKLLASYNLSVEEIRFPEHFSIDTYYILITSGLFDEYLDFLNSQEGVKKAFESSMIGADYKPYILDRYSGKERIIKLTAEKGQEVIFYGFNDISIKQVKQDKIIWGYINPKGKNDSEIICSLKEDEKVLSTKPTIAGSIASN